MSNDLCSTIPFNTMESYTPPKKTSFVKEVLTLIIVVCAIVIPVRMFIAQPFIVSGSSMKSTYEDGQYLIIDRLTYHFNEPQRGDVIVFRYPDNPKKFFIKRIIGLPNETVTIEGEEVRITTKSGDEEVLDEPYVRFPKESVLTEDLGPNEYFVMGDNRRDSYDSRSWGPLEEDEIIGRAFLRLLPISKIDLLTDN